MAPAGAISLVTNGVFFFPEPGVGDSKATVYGSETRGGGEALSACCIGCQDMSDRSGMSV